MKKVGLIGWRGMVGSVLMDRMREENDFAHIEPIFFTTSQAGQAAPDVGVEVPLLKSAFDIDVLSEMDIIVTCQGGDYTKEVYPQLRKEGWNGYWIDAASALLFLTRLICRSSKMAWPMVLKIISVVTAL